MEIIVKQSDLAQELALLISIAKRNKSTIPVLQNVLLSADAGRVLLTASDLSVGGEISCPAKIIRPGSTTIPAARLHDYVRLLPDSEVRLLASDTHWATISCGRSKSRIAGMPDSSYPELPTRPESFASISARGMAKLISQTFFAISHEESRFSLNGAQLIASDGRITLAATDGHRLALASDTATVNEPAKLIISRDTLQELQRMASAAEDEAVFECSEEQNHVFFSLGSRVLFGRKLSGAFPEIDRVLPRRNKFTVELHREELLAAILRGKGFADDRSHALSLLFKQSELVLSASTDSSNFEESIPLTDGPTIDTKFNGQYLLDFLRASTESKIALLLNDGTEAMEMRPVIGEDASAAAPAYRYIVMPMRG